MSTKTIRYYEDIGLLPPPPRLGSGYRDYDPATLDRLAFIRAAQAVGLSLGEIRARVKGTSVNALIVESLAAEVERVRRDKDFTARAKRLLARDKELLDRLAQ